MVNGLQIPQEKPHPTAKIEQVIPVSLSQPKLIHRAQTIGTKGMISSKDPIKAPIAMKNRIRIAKKR